jgi:hypothetical protein
MRIILLWVCLLCSGYAAAAGKLYIQEKAVFADGAAVRDLVNNKCNLEEFLGNKISQTVLVAIPDSVLISKEAPAARSTILENTILAARRIDKSSASVAGYDMTIRSDYKMAGQVVATKVTPISSTAFANLGSTCSNLEKDADAMALQIAKWLSEVRDDQVADAGKNTNAPQSTEEAAVDDDSFLINSVATFQDDESGRVISKRSKSECGLERSIPIAVLKYAEKYRVRATLHEEQSTEAATSKIVSLEIRNVVGARAGNGFWNGRWVESEIGVMLTLKRGNATEIAHKYFACSAGLGIITLANIRPCQRLSKCSDQLGNKMAKWLRTGLDNSD